MSWKGLPEESRMQSTGRRPVVDVTLQGSGVLRPPKLVDRAKVLQRLRWATLHSAISPAPPLLRFSPSWAASSSR